MKDLTWIFFFLSPFHRWFEHSIKRWEGQVSGAQGSELSSSDSVHQGPPTRTHQLFCLGQLPPTSACRQEQPGPPPNLFYVRPTQRHAHKMFWFSYYSVVFIYNTAVAKRILREQHKRVRLQSSLQTEGCEEHIAKKDWTLNLERTMITLQI